MARGHGKGCFVTLLIGVTMVMVTLVVPTGAQGAVIVTPTVEAMYQGGTILYLQQGALDDQGTVHAILGERESATYVTNAGGPYSYMSMGYLATGTLALDDAGVVHILRTFSNQDSTSELVYTTDASGPWNNATIANGSTNGYGWLKVDVDSQRRPYAMYTETIDAGGVMLPDLKFATFTGGAWTNVTLVNGVDLRYLGMAVDPQDRVHAFMVNGTGTDLVYATSSAGSWSFFVLDSGVVPDSVNFVVDGQGYSHVCYRTSSGTLLYRANVGGLWTVQVVATQTSGTPSMQLGSGNTPHIAYLTSAGGTRLMYANRSGGSWFATTVDEGMQGKAYLALGSHDTASIVYSELSGQDEFGSDRYDLRYATDLGGAWSSQSLGPLLWPDQAVDLSQFYPPMMDGAGRLHLIFNPLVPAGGGTMYQAVLETRIAYPPNTPRDFTAMAGDGMVQLNWTAPVSDGGAAVTGYNLTWSTDPNGTFTAIRVNATEYVHTGLVNGTTYYYRVAAINAAGQGPPSELVSATPVPPTSLPSAPVNLKASPGAGSVKLTWNAPSDDGGTAVIGYSVFRGTGSSNMTLIATVAATSFVDSEVEQGTRYFYQVSAVNADGMGLPSGIVNAVPSPPPAPTNIPIEYLVITGVGVALAAVAVGVYIIRRRSGP